MKIVLDKNILLTSLKNPSKDRPIFDSLIEGKYFLIVTTDILLEYIEKIEEKTNAVIANNVGDLIMTLSNVEKINVKFNWLLITLDMDDNKFVDGAVAGNADYLVTNDGHFNILKSIDFPPVKILSSKDFLEILNKI